MASKTWIATNDDYLRVLRGLLPKGLLWTREPARRLTKHLQGIADELVRAHNAVTGLVNAAIPDVEGATGYLSYSADPTAYLLDGWLRVVGINYYGKALLWDPDPSSWLRSNVVGVLSKQGGQTAAYFKSYLEGLGYTDVDVFDGPFPFYFTVVSGNAYWRRARAGTMRAGTDLIWHHGSTYLWDNRRGGGIKPLKPLHTMVWFTDHHYYHEP